MPQVYQTGISRATFEGIGSTTWRSMQHKAVWVLAGLVLIVAACSRLNQGEQARMAPIAWKLVDEALGKPGALQPDGAYKVGLPRGDLHVIAAGVAVKPTFALGSWVAFKQVSDTDAMLMADLVLLESEIAPILGQLQEGGIEQTGLHNHRLHESPRVMYMHIAGRGSPARLAGAIHAALALTGTPWGAPPPSRRPTGRRARHCH